MIQDDFIELSILEWYKEEEKELSSLSVTSYFKVAAFIINAQLNEDE